MESCHATVHLSQDVKTVCVRHGCCTEWCQPRGPKRDCTQQLEGFWLATTRHVPSLTSRKLLCFALDFAPAWGTVLVFSDPTVYYKALCVEAMKLKIASHHVSLTQLWPSREMPAPSKPKKDKRVELPQEEMDMLEVSQSPLRSASHGDVKADLLQHHARLEKLLLEMLVKILDYILLHSRAFTA